MSVRTVPAPTGAPAASQKLERVLRAGMERKEAPTALAHRTVETPGFLLITWREEILDNPAVAPYYKDTSDAVGAALSIALDPNTADNGPRFDDEDLRLLHLVRQAGPGPTGDSHSFYATTDLARGYIFNVIEERYREWEPAKDTALTNIGKCRRIPKTRYKIWARLEAENQRPQLPRAMSTGPGL